MEPLKISLCVYLKNPDRPSPSYYARMRMDGRTTDIPLQTKDRAVAETWVRLRKDEIRRYNDYCLVGEEPPEDLLRKLPILGQKHVQKPRLTLRGCYESWELEMRRRGMREKSIEGYLKDIRLTVPLDEPLTAFTRDNARLWLSKHDHLMANTRKHHSVALHEFAKYLVEYHGLDFRVAQNWPKVKVVTVERGFWRMNEIYHIIEAVSCLDQRRTEQFKVYLWIMATAGSRQGETYALRWSDYRDGCLTFRAETTKNNRTRVVPLDMRVCAMLERIRHGGTQIFDALPRSQAGRYDILERAVKASGMPAGGLHKMRHSSCMYLYAHCQDIKAVAQLAGHSPETSMSYYIKSREADELREVVDKAYGSELMIPDSMDRLIEDGLV